VDVERTARVCTRAEWGEDDGTGCGLSDEEDLRVCF